jgi:hypothetical protein
MSLILCAAMAWAQAEPTGSEVAEEPLAIPVDQAPPASPQPEPPASGQQTPVELAIPVNRPPQAPSQPARPLAIPRAGISAQDAAAQRAYARQRLSVEAITEMSLSSATVSTWGYGGGFGYGGYGGYGRWGYGWGPSWGFASVPVMTARQSWAVFEGDHRLDVPTALEKLQQVPLKTDLERRIRRSRTAGTLWTGVGVAGLIGGVAGLVGLDQSRTYDEARAWSMMATTSTVVGVSGLVIGTFPSAKARRLFVDPSLTLSREDAEATADTVNEALRVQLGLSPEQALRLEQPDAPAPRRR